jgi:hypothetical protein
MYRERERRPCDNNKPPATTANVPRRVVSMIFTQDGSARRPKSGGVGWQNGGSGVRRGEREREREEEGLVIIFGPFRSHIGSFLLFVYEATRNI